MTHTDRTILGAACAILLASTAVEADSYLVLSHAKAMDGKTIEDKDGKRYRLQGIDAPELGQSCLGSDGEEYACGEASRDALAEILNGIVTCDILGSGADEWQPVRCRNFLDLDIGAQLVAAGWAVPDRRNGMDYVFNEMEAEARDLGLWKGKFVPPNRWRAGTRL